jgi:TolB-like protein
VRCALEVQRTMVERNAGVPPERRIEFRVGIHLGDVVEEADGDLMGDGVNIAARVEGVCEPGGVCLSEDAYRQVRDRVKEEFADLGDRELKNIVRPIRVYAVKIGSESGAQALPASPPDNKKPPRLSFVVLPFVNLSNDPAQDYFADGITENLTTELTRIRNSFVIARNTAFSYKGRHLDVRQIGRELNVRYVLEGSVQRGGDRVRVNAQLIDAESGAHLWADRFEEEVADLFKLQDHVVARLARTLQIELVNTEAQRSLHDRPRNPDAIDLTMRGLSVLNQTTTKASSYEARDLFEQALTLDPANADALAGAARADMSNYIYGWSDQPDLYARAMQRANQALLLNPNHAIAHYAKAALIMIKVKANDAASANEVIAEAEASLRADPSLPGPIIPWPSGKCCSVATSTRCRISNRPCELVHAIQVSVFGTWRWADSFWRCVEPMRRFRKASKPSTWGIATLCLTLPLQRSTLRQTRRRRQAPRWPRR